MSGRDLSPWRAALIQQQRYSDKNMRSIPFTEAEIAASLLPQGEVTIRAN